MTQRPIVGIIACRTEISGKPAHRVSEKYVDALKRVTDCIPLTMYMAKVGATLVHKMNRNVITKLFGFFLVIIASRFLYDYFNF